MSMMLIDQTKDSACKTAEADAIRAKTGGSAQIAYDFANNKGFADAIAAISAGGGDYEIEGGTFTLTSNAKTKSVSCSFQPESVVMFAIDSTFPTDNVWKTLAGIITVWQTESFVIQRYGASNINGAERKATSHTYSGGTLTFSWNYVMASGVTYYWFAWRART